MYYANANYNTTKTNLTASGNDPGRVGQLHNAGGSYYLIERYMAIFDTSTIPAGATILAATFKGRITAMGAAHVETIRLMNGQPGAPSNPPVNGDYDEALYAGNGGEISTNGWAAPPFLFSFALNATGLTWLQVAGITKLCWKCSNDINGNPPPNNTDETWYFDQIQLDLTYDMLFGHGFAKGGPGCKSWAWNNYDLGD